MSRQRVEISNDTLSWSLSWLDEQRELPRIHRVCKQWQAAAKRCEERIPTLRLRAMTALPAWLGTTNATRWAKQVKRLEMRLPPFVGCLWSNLDMRVFRAWVRSMPNLQSLHVQHLTLQQGETAFPTDIWQLTVPLTSLSLLDTPVSGDWLAKQTHLTELSFGVELETQAAARLPPNAVFPNLRALDWNCITLPSSESSNAMAQVIGRSPWHRFPKLERLVLAWETPRYEDCARLRQLWERPGSTLQWMQARDCDQHHQVQMQRRPAVLVIDKAHSPWLAIVSMETEWSDSVTVTGRRPGLASLQCTGRLTLDANWEGVKETLAEMNLESVTRLDVDAEYMVHVPDLVGWLGRMHKVRHVSVDVEFEYLGVVLEHLSCATTFEARVLYASGRPPKRVSILDPARAAPIAALFDKHPNLVSVAGTDSKGQTRVRYTRPSFDASKCFWPWTCVPL